MFTVNYSQSCCTFGTYCNTAKELFNLHSIPYWNNFIPLIIYLILQYIIKLNKY